MTFLKGFNHGWSSLDIVGNKGKGESQNGGKKKTKHAKFSEKGNISYPLIRTRACVYQGVRNVRGFEIRLFALLPTI